MLCPFTRILKDALTDKRAVGAFNVGNMEMLIGIVKAAEDLRSPIVLQIAEKRFKHSPLEYVGPMMFSVAQKAKIEIALELDHGFTVENIRRSLAFGFNSIMFDGSDKPVAENIRLTSAVAKEVHNQGAALEAEIGVVGGSEGGAMYSASCARLEDIIKLGSESECDALAVAIGNAHGHYKGVPKLNFELLQQSHAALPGMPLVLHGGTGIAPEDFRKAITMGICKINIATANFDAFVAGAAAYCQAVAPDSRSYFGLNESAVEKIYENTCAHIRLFNNTEPLDVINF